MALILRNSRPSGDSNNLTPTEIDGNFTTLNAYSFDVRKFISGSGTTVTDATINSAISALPSTGGKIELPGGLNYQLNNPILLTKPVVLAGHGKASMYRTQIPTNLKVTHTGAAFNIQHSATNIRDLHLEFTGTQTGSTYDSKAIIVDIREPLPPQLAQYASQYPNGLPSSYAISRISTANFNTNIHQVNGAEGQIDYCDFHTFYKYGLQLECLLEHDLGDLSVHGCNFYAEKYSSIAGVIQTGGGGTKFGSCKWNQRAGNLMQYGYYGKLDGGTSIVNFVNNSFENIADTSIKIVPGNFSFEMATVVGNEFASYAYQGYNPVGYINFSGVKGCSVGYNIFRKAATSAHAIILDELCTDYNIGKQSFFGYTSIQDAVNISSGATPSIQIASDTPPVDGGLTESTFNDSFTTADNTAKRWSNTSQGDGNATFTTGLVLQPGIYTSGEANRAQYTTINTYNMVGKSVIVNIESLGYPSDNASSTLFVSIGGGSRVGANNVAMVVQGNVLYAQIADGSAFQSVAYNATTMKYWKLEISSDGNTFTASYSANGSTYTTLWATGISISMASSRVYLFSNNSDSNAVHSPTKITNVKLS